MGIDTLGVEASNTKVQSDAVTSTFEQINQIITRIQEDLISIQETLKGTARRMDRNDMALSRLEQSIHLDPYHVLRGHPGVVIVPRRDMPALKESRFFRVRKGP